jgi:putative transposase
VITGPITQGKFESIFRALKKAVIERAMSAEMNQHLGYKHGEAKPAGQTNERNGLSGKPCSLTMVRWISRCHATATAASSR